MGKYINLKWPLRAYQRGFFQGNDSTIAAVTEDIKTLLLTNKGERLINSDMGTNLPVFEGVLFDQMSKAELTSRVDAEIRSALEKWMPHVKLVRLELLTDEENDIGFNKLIIKMDYVLNNSEAAGDSIQLTVISNQGLS